MGEAFESLAVLNRDIMKELIGDDMEYIKKCELDFIKQAQGTYNEIVGAFKQGDFRLIKDKAHFLKTSSKAIGAEQLSHLLQELEHRSLGADASGCKTLIVHTGKSIKTVYEEIRSA